MGDPLSTYLIGYALSVGASVTWDAAKAFCNKITETVPDATTIEDLRRQVEANPKDEGLREQLLAALQAQITQLTDAQRQALLQAAEPAYETMPQKVWDELQRLQNRGGLPLTLPKGNPQETYTAEDNRILNAYNRAIPFQGRTEELAALHAWAADDEHLISVWTYHADGGQGKTRLALEFGHQLVKQFGWRAGFLRQQTLQTYQGLADWQPSQDQLIIIDYAEGAREALRQFLLSLGDNYSGQRKIRVLLLERFASADSGWWHETFNSYLGSDSYALGQLQVLPPQALDRSGQALNIIGATLEAVKRPDFLTAHFAAIRKGLEQAQWQHRPLFAIMAALIMLDPDKGIAAAMALNGLEMAENRAGKEWEQLKKVKPRHEMEPNDWANLLSHGLCLATLAGGVSVKDCFTVLSKTRDDFCFTVSQENVSDARNWLKDLRSKDGKTIAPIQPDILGEAFILRHMDWLNQESDDPEAPFDGQLAKAAFDLNSQGTTETLSRTLRDYPIGLPSHAKAGRISPVKNWLSTMIPSYLKQSPHPFAILLIYSNLPQQQFGLENLKIAMLTQVLNRLDNLSEVLDEENVQDFRARTLNNLSVDYSTSGQHNEAMKAASEAVKIYKKITGDAPNKYMPDLASALNNLSNTHYTFGQYSEAMQATDEAIEIYKTLVMENPDKYKPDLAMTLNNLSTCHSAFGQNKEAIYAANEALKIYKKLLTDSPDKYSPDLASTLNNLGAFHMNLGQYNDSIKTTVEALQFYKKISRDNPDKYRPDLASALNNLSICHSAFGNHNESMKAAKEVMQIYKEFAYYNPDKFSPELAFSLNNLSTCHMALGQYKEAMQAASNSVQIYEQIAKGNSDQFEPDLAMALNNLSTCHSVIGQHKEAMQAASNAVQIYKNISRDNPDQFRIDLTRTLKKLSSFHSVLGQHKEAMITAREAVHICSKLASEIPEKYLPELLISLGNSGHIFARADEPRAAHHFYSKGMSILCQILPQNPKRIAKWALKMAEEYTNNCLTLEHEPDWELLEHIYQTIEEAGLIDPPAAPEAEEPGGPGV